MKFHNKVLYRGHVKGGGGGMVQYGISVFDIIHTYTFWNIISNDSITLFAWRVWRLH